MRSQLLRALREAFPDSKVATYFNREKNTEGIVVLKGNMYTVFVPEPELWKMPYSQEAVEQIVEEIRQIGHYNVDPFDDEAEVKEESRGI